MGGVLQHIISNSYSTGTFAHILLPFIHYNVCLYGLQTLVRELKVTELKEQSLPSLNWFVLLITVSFLCLTVVVEENSEFWPSNREQTFHQKIQML